jgi:GntR family transcriptional regulator, transcriptional repressor for pyruvate dehydrogenase complex
MSVAEEPGTGRIRRQVIAEEVAARIEELIASGELAVGDKLPPERELARELHISRPTLREGIRALSATGTVRVEHGKGSFVASHPSQARRVTADGLAAPFTRAVRIRLRALLFAAAAAQAAVRLDQAALDELTGRLTAATSDGGPGAVHELVDTLRAHGDDRLGPLLEVLWPDGADRPVTPGAGLVQALGARDPSAAFDAAFSTLME